MLAIANAVLAIVSVVLYIGTDRKEPTFEFTETNVIYEEGMEESPAFWKVSWLMITWMGI